VGWLSPLAAAVQGPASKVRWHPTQARDRRRGAGWHLVAAARRLPGDRAVGRGPNGRARTARQAKLRTGIRSVTTRRQSHPSVAIDAEPVEGRARREVTDGVLSIGTTHATWAWADDRVRWRFCQLERRDPARMMPPVLVAGPGVRMIIATAGRVGTSWQRLRADVLTDPPRDGARPRTLAPLRGPARGAPGNRAIRRPAGPPSPLADLRLVLRWPPDHG